MASDTDVSFWSVVHPEVLIMSSLRMVEVFNRNTEGVRDWDGAIATEMRTIDSDYVDEEIAKIDQMEG